MEVELRTSFYVLFVLRLRNSQNVSILRPRSCLSVVPGWLRYLVSFIALCLLKINFIYTTSSPCRSASASAWLNTLLPAWLRFGVNKVINCLTGGWPNPFPLFFFFVPALIRNSWSLRASVGLSGANRYVSMCFYGLFCECPLCWLLTVGGWWSSAYVAD